MIQIDGLSRLRLEKALSEGKMPHLQRLVAEQSLLIHSLYSGLPSCTPASQAELFYGVKNAVPAFAFLEQKTGKIVKMFSHGTATAIQKDLEGGGRSLLAEGSSYSNIFNGGALRSSYCACQMGFGGILANLGSLGLLPLVFRHPHRLLRILGLMAMESGLAIRDTVRAKVRPDMWHREAIFFVNRIFVSVFLREMITILAARDIRQGLPIVHVNFMGYDEHAHQRGPDSQPALDHLRNIDAAISGLVRAVAKASRRYQCWIYSDHGQESVESFAAATGKSLEAAISEATGGMPVVRIPDPHRPGRLSEPSPRTWLVSNPGPLISLYPSAPLTLAQKEAISQILVSKARVPMVFHSPEKGRVRACTAEGWRELPGDARTLLGADHPFPEECASDLLALCQHPLAGPLIVSGWHAGVTPLSFFSESGSHGGMGKEEVHGFALLPASVSLPSGKAYFRFLDLRNAVLDVLGPDGRTGLADASRQPQEETVS